MAARTAYTDEQKKEFIAIVEAGKTNKSKWTEIFSAAQAAGYTGKVQALKMLVDRLTNASKAAIDGVAKPKRTWSRRKKVVAPAEATTGSISSAIDSAIAELDKRYNEKIDELISKLSAKKKK